MELLKASSDIALLIDDEGQVLDVSIADASLSETLHGHLIGRRLHDTVTEESRTKVSELLESARQGEAPRWRQVNHQAGRAADEDHPVRYCAMKLDSGKRLLVVGRDLQLIADLQQQLISAQETSERDFWRLRQAESRFRLLFQVCSDAVLVVDTETERVLEVNPVAEALLGADRKVGRLAALFEADTEQNLRLLLARAGTAGSAEGNGFSLRDSGEALSLRVSALRQGNSSIYLIILLPPERAGEVRSPLIDRTLGLIDHAPDGVVICDEGGVVLHANPSFIELAQLHSPEQAVGQPLGTWLGRSAVDVNVLLANVRKHGAVRNYATAVRGALNVSAGVEVAGCLLDDVEEGESAYGFVLRSTEQRPGGSDVVRTRSVDQLTELVGKVPLKELVRESADLIERLSIEAALTLTSNNRAAAAEMLGLSRQSLYVKLRRYGIGDSESSAAD